MSEKNKHIPLTLPEMEALLNVLVNDIESLKKRDNIIQESVNTFSENFTAGMAHTEEIILNKMESISQISDLHTNQITDIAYLLQNLFSMEINHYNKMIMQLRRLEPEHPQIIDLEKRVNDWKELKQMLEGKKEIKKETLDKLDKIDIKPMEKENPKDLSIMDLKRSLNKKTLLYYLAHPYTGNTLTHESNNVLVCTNYMNKLLDKGYIVYAPIIMTHEAHLLSERKYDFWINFNKPFMKRCDALILCGNWKESKGCMMELKYFRKHNKPIMIFDGHNLVYLEELENAGIL